MRQSRWAGVLVALILTAVAFISGCGASGPSSSIGTSAAAPTSLFQTRVVSDTTSPPAPSSEGTPGAIIRALAEPGAINYRVTLKDASLNPWCTTAAQVSATMDGTTVELHAFPPATDPTVEAENQKARNEGRYADLRYDQWQYCTWATTSGDHTFSFQAQLVHQLITGEVEHTVSQTDVLMADARKTPQTRTPVKRAAANSGSGTPPPTVYNGPPPGEFLSDQASIVLSSQVATSPGTLSASVTINPAYQSSSIVVWLDDADPTSIAVDGVPFPANQVGTNGSSPFEAITVTEPRAAGLTDVNFRLPVTSGNHVISFKILAGNAGQFFTQTQNTNPPGTLWAGPLVGLSGTIPPQSCRPSPR